MYTKEEITELYNKNYHREAYRAIATEYSESIEKFGFKFTLAKIKEELNLPISYMRLYHMYWRRKEKGKEREKMGSQEGLPSAPAARAPKKKEKEREKMIPQGAPALAPAMSVLVEKTQSIDARLEKMERSATGENKIKWSF